MLEQSYRRMRSIEAALLLEDLPPEDALRRLVGLPSITTRATSRISVW